MCERESLTIIYQFSDCIHFRDDGPKTTRVSIDTYQLIDVEGTIRIDHVLRIVGEQDRIEIPVATTMWDGCT